MPASKAQQRAVSKYMKENYDEIKVRVSKGQKSVIQAHATAQGESVNSFINRAIDQTMAQEAVGSPTRPVDAGVVSLSSEMLEAAQRAVEATGEALPDFMVRAVATQAKRDQSSLRLGINPATGGKLGKE